MKKLLTLAFTLLFATIAFAEKPITRTVIIKDGKVITDGQEEAFENVLLGGPRAFLGVSLMNISPELREHFGAPEGSGVMVESVQKDSPAERAGIRVGDIVLSIDGKEVKWSGDLRKGLRDKKEGDAVRIEVLRNRARQTLVATVKEREAPRMFNIGELPTMLGSPEFRARIERLGGNCVDLQSRIKELETRLKELEKKLQK